MSRSVTVAALQKREVTLATLTIGAGLGLAWSIVTLPAAVVLVGVAVVVGLLVVTPQAVIAARNGVLLPFLFVFSLAFTGLRRDVGFWVLELSQVVLLIGLISWALAMVSHRTGLLKLDGVGTWAFLVVLAAVLSGLGALDLTAWLKRTTKIAMLFGAYVYLVSTVQRVAQTVSLIQAGVLASLVASLFMLVQTTTLAGINPTFELMEYSVVGTFRNRNEAATFIGIFVISVGAFYALRVHRQWLGRHISAAIWLCIVGIVLTRSRSGLLATVGASVLLLLYSRRMWRPLAIAGLVLLLTWNLPVTRFFVSSRLLPMLGASSGNVDFDAFVSAGWYDRLYLWGIYWDTIKAHPVFGIGVANYDKMAQLNLNFSQPMAGTWANSADAYLGQDAHNGYLNWWAETGTVGVIPFVGSLVWAVLGLARMLRCPGLPLLAKANTLAALGAVVIFTGTNLLSDFGVYEPRYWFVLAFASIVLRDGRRSERQPASERSVPASRAEPGNRSNTTRIQTCAL